MPMRTFTFNKLVRDKILQQMEEAGDVVKWHRLEDESFGQELIKKLEEELDELDEEFGKDRERDLGELADVAEVYETAWDIVDRDEHYDILADAMDELDKGLDVWEISPDELLAAKEAKNEKVGAFALRVYIETVTVSDDSPWLERYLASPDKYPEVA